MKRFLKRLKTALLMAALIVTTIAVTGCRLSFSWLVNDKKALIQGRQSLTEGEMRVIALEYKTLFESYYCDLLGSAFWQSEIAESYSFESYVKDRYILEEASALLYLNEIAEERSIRITDAKREELEEKAETFVGDLSLDERAFLGAGSDTVFRVLLMYETAALAIESFLGGERIEVSGEESRVADVQMIRTNDLSTAEELLKRIRNGENFLTVAKENTVETKTTYSLAREDIRPEIADVVFSLRTGEISDVVSCDGSYYIFRILNGYNTLLSANNRKNLIAVRQYESWSEEFESYRKENAMRLSERFWKTLSLSQEGSFTYRHLLSDEAAQQR